LGKYKGLLEFIELLMVFLILFVVEVNFYEVLYFFADLSLSLSSFSFDFDFLSFNFSENLYLIYFSFSSSISEIYFNYVQVLTIFLDEFGVVLLPSTEMFLNSNTLAYTLLIPIFDLIDAKYFSYFYFFLFSFYSFSYFLVYIDLINDAYLERKKFCNFSFFSFDFLDFFFLSFLFLFLLLNYGDLDFYLYI